MEKTSNTKLSRRVLWGYSIGAIPAGLLAFIFGLKYIEFFYDSLQLLPVYFIAGQVIYMIVNAINDPLLGQLSDRTNSKRFGSRRIIYIKYGAPIWALTFLLVWIPWSFDNQIIIFLHFVISICLFDTMLTLVILVWMALLPEMTQDLDERNKANFLVLVIGGIVVIPFLLILGEMDPTSMVFLFLMIIVAIISTILLWVTAHFSEERPEFQNDKGFPLGKAVVEAFKIKSYLLYLGFNFCNAFLGSIGLSYLFAYLFLLGEVGILWYFVIFVFVGYGSNYFFMKIRDKLGMRGLILRFGMAKVAVTIIIFVTILFIEEPLIIIIGLGINTFLGGYGIFNTPLMYLSMDEDEIKNGSRREGIFLGINALIHKPAQSIGPIVATMILAIFGFQQGSDVQPPSALLGIKILMFLIPAIVSAIGLIFMYFYPYNKETVEELNAKLELLHEEKRKLIS